MKKLISMVDFVLEQKDNNKIDSTQRFINCVEYAKFLKQPLELGFFVPVSESGEVLDNPNNEKIYHSFKDNGTYLIADRMYNEAKSKVLFKGFNVDVKKSGRVYFDREDLELFAYSDNKFRCQTMSGIHLKTVEDLVKYNLTLTETALKQIGI